jgi:hypothetical protein
MAAVNADNGLNKLGSTNIIARSDADNIIAQINALQSVVNKKRELANDDVAQLDELKKRADDSLSNLIIAFANSGMIGAVSSTLSSDPDLKDALVNLVESAVSGFLAQAPTLISAIWNSGLLGKLLHILLNDSELDSALFQVGEDVVSAVISLVTQYFFGSDSSSATTTTAAATSDATAAAAAATFAISTKATSTLAATTGTTTSFTPAAPAATGASGGNNILSSLASKYKREEAPQFLDERDSAELVKSAVRAVSDSGLLSEFINKTLANPSAGVSFLTAALQDGTVHVDDLYNWAKSSGAFDDFLTWFKTNVPTYVGAFSGVLNKLADSGEAAANAKAPAPTTLLSKRMLY